MQNGSSGSSSVDARRQWAAAGGVYGALAVFFAFTAHAYLERYPVAAPGAAAIYICLLWILALFLLPAFPALRGGLRRRFSGPRGALASIGFFLLPYSVYAAGTGDFQLLALVKLAAIAAIPLGVLAWWPVREPRRLNVQDVAALAGLAGPVLLRWIHGIWNVPVNLDFMARLYVVAVGAWAFLIVRGMEGSGFEARVDRKILRHALLNFAAFAVVAIPLGFALGFISWNPNWRGGGAFAFDFLTLFLFIAVPEELLFRGLLQNLLEGSWNSRYKAQAAASVLFGLMHILHAPFPNWPYVLLASIAGWFYGQAWRNTRSLTASSTTHALVDAVWRTWFERI